MAPVLSAALFSLPLPPWLQPASSRVEQYDRKKRKRPAEWTDTDGEGADTTDAASVVDSQPGGQSLVLTPNEVTQYRAAGLSLDQELPGGNFPHAPVKSEHSNPENLPSHLLRGLSSLSTPIFPPQTPAHQGNLRLQHLAVLTAILHRCLLEGDYVRAGRAWGLILREDFRGFPVDVRNEGRWGIGAEILLRRNNQDASVPTNSGDRTLLPFTKKGFAEAKDYYERLILNHPYMKTAPNAVSALHFYPAMFGLWIYVAQEESTFAREQIKQDADDFSDEYSDNDTSSIDFDRRQSDKRQKLIARIREQELDQAQQIATRLDSLLGSPPYSDCTELLELRGMVSLWIGDLLLSSLESPPDPEDDLRSDIPPHG
ncbi:hypothetical protein N7470_001661 [Penicillium chermesinum]|nr:hypothetical protein N7470_001661 [Penicillium chermesinum]